MAGIQLFNHENSKGVPLVTKILSISSINNMNIKKLCLGLTKFESKRKSKEVLKDEINVNVCQKSKI